MFSSLQSMRLQKTSYSKNDFLMNKKWQKYIAECNDKYLERLAVLEKYKKQNELFFANYNKNPLFLPTFYILYI